MRKLNSSGQGAECSAFVKSTAKRLGIPGVAVGIWAGGKSFFSTCGVTSIENPLPVDEDTLYILGSVTKTYTATALMCLVAAGKVELNAPVLRYVPELKLADQGLAEEITVLNLLNHTSGLDWGLIMDTGEGDDAIASYISKMKDLKQIANPGSRVSYSQAGYNLIGRIIEKVTGLSFEQAVYSLLFKPLSLSNSFFNRDDIMTRRFCTGHNRSDDGSIEIARLWRRSRGDNPGGGIASSIKDQLNWARFHLITDHVRAEKLMPIEVIRTMQQSTAELRASNLGDAIGLGWFLREINGVKTIGHGGSANGQFADILLVPGKEFAVVSLSNSGPEGITFNKEIIRWTLDNYLGLTDKDAELLEFSDQMAKEIVGAYENEVMTLTIRSSDQKLNLEVLIKPEIRAASDKELPPDHSPFYFSLLSGKKDEYMITSGAFKDQRGFFTRDEDGFVTGVDLAGRLFGRCF